MVKTVINEEVSTGIEGNEDKIPVITLENESQDVEIDLVTTKNDYNVLFNKPRINGHVLIGDKTGQQLDLVDTTAFEIEVIERIKSAENLQEQIDNLKKIGRFLSLWDCSTGYPETNPPKLPYNYNTGDYYIVSKTGATNYKPIGSFYDGNKSELVETKKVAAYDIYFYDGTTWNLLENSSRNVSFADIKGHPYDNINLKEVLDSKVFANTPIPGGTHTKITYDSKGLVIAGSDITLSDVTDVKATVEEVNYLKGVRKHVQEQIDSKQDVLTAGSNIEIKDNVVSAKTYVYEQAEPSTTWVIQHNLDMYPSVCVIDSEGNELECEVIYINNNVCKVTSNVAFSGTAYLN